MSENVSFIQGSKENYNPSEMAGGVFFSKDTKEILLTELNTTILHLKRLQYGTVLNG